MESSCSYHLFNPIHHIKPWAHITYCLLLLIPTRYTSTAPDCDASPISSSRLCPLVTVPRPSRSRANLEATHNPTISRIHNTTYNPHHPYPVFISSTPTSHHASPYNSQQTQQDSRNTILHSTTTHFPSTPIHRRSIRLHHAPQYKHPAHAETSIPARKETDEEEGFMPAMLCCARDMMGTMALI